MPEQKPEVGMWVRSITRGIGKIIDIGAGIEIPRGSAKIWHSDTESSIVSMNNLTLLRAPGEFKVGDKCDYVPCSLNCITDTEGDCMTTLSGMCDFLSNDPDDTMNCHVSFDRCRQIVSKRHLRLITPVEARGEQKGSSCESQSANSADGSSSERESRTTPEGVTKAARGATQGSAQKNSENAKDKKTIEPSYFPPDSQEITVDVIAPLKFTEKDIEVSMNQSASVDAYSDDDDDEDDDAEEEPAGAKYFRLQRDEESVARAVAMATARYIASVDGDTRAMQDAIDERNLTNETRAERIAKHFGGTGEPSVNRRNGTIGGR